MACCDLTCHVCELLAHAFAYPAVPVLFIYTDTWHVSVGHLPAWKRIKITVKVIWLFCPSVSMFVDSVELRQCSEKHLIIVLFFFLVVCILYIVCKSAYCCLKMLHVYAYIISHNSLYSSQYLASSINHSEKPKWTEMFKMFSSTTCLRTVNYYRIILHVW